MLNAAHCDHQTCAAFASDIIRCPCLLNPGQKFLFDRRRVVFRLHLFSHNRLCNLQALCRSNTALNCRSRTFKAARRASPIAVGANELTNAATSSEINSSICFCSTIPDCRSSHTKPASGMIVAKTVLRLPTPHHPIESCDHFIDRPLANSLSALLVTKTHKRHYGTRSLYIKRWGHSCA